MFDTEVLVEQLIETQKLIDKLLAKKEDLVNYLKADDTFSGVSNDKVTIKKYKSRTTVLKDGIEKDDMMNKFPAAVKTSLDMKVLAEITEAHDYLELKETEILSVKVK